MTSPPISEMSLIANRYRVLAHIGSGGMGSVFRAYDRLTRTTVALKQVTVSDPDDDITTGPGDVDLRLALAQEFKTLASVRHPHIISVLDYGFDANQQPYFTMELLEDAQPLYAAALDLPLDQKVDLLAQVLYALSYLHRRGIVHRDLKPGNVLVSNGQAKVVDFGLAVVRDWLSEKALPLEERVVGTLAYLSPETLRGYPVNPACDLYALGVMAYELFAGHHPYNLDDPTDFLEELFLGDPDLTRMDVDPRLADVVGKLMLREADGRYANAEDVIEALSVVTQRPINVESKSTRESVLQSARFVGRDDELYTLEVALNEARAGHGSAWLIGGESGVGKTRLLEELRARALIAGLPVLSGQSVDTGRMPYRQWRRPVRHLALHTPLSDLEAGVLQGIVPDLSEVIERDIPPVTRLEGNAHQQRVVQTILALFRRQEQPAVLLLEDLHWATESLQPLQALLDVIARLPLLVVGTYRDEERPGLADALPDMHLIKLNRLSDDEIVQLSESMLGYAGRHEEVINLLRRETEGNTYFIVEVVRALVEDAGHLSRVGQITLPERVVTGGLQAVIRRRLELVPESALHLLKVAAVAGREVNLPVMQALVSKEALNQWLTHCSDAGVIDIIDEHWQFTHDKLREALLDTLKSDEIPALHRRVAEGVEAVFGDDPTRSSTLVHHWYMAGDALKTAHYASIAADQAILVSDFDEAGYLLGRALELLDGHDKTVTAQEAEAILYRLMGAMNNRQSEYAHAVKHYHQSIDLARSAGADSVVAESLNGLAYVEAMQDDLESAYRHIQEALTVAQVNGDTLNEARSLNNLGLVYEWREDFDAALDHYEQSRVLFRQMDDKRGIASALNNLGTTADSLGKLDEARQYYRESLSLCREIGFVHGIATIANNLGILNERLRDLDAAWHSYQDSLEIARVANDRRGIAVALLNLTFVAVALNRMDDARLMLRDAADALKAVEAGRLTPHLICAGAAYRLANGDAEGAAAFVGLVGTMPELDTDLTSLRLDPLRVELERTLSAEALNDALERGARLSLETARDCLLADLEVATTVG